MTKSKLEKPGENYSEWNAVDVAISPDKGFDQRSTGDFFAYIFGSLSVVTLIISFLNGLFASNMSEMVRTIEFLLNAIAFGVLAVFCAVMSSRHFMTRKLRLSHRSVYDKPLEL